MTAPTRFPHAMQAALSVFAACVFAFAGGSARAHEDHAIPTPSQTSHNHATADQGHDANHAHGTHAEPTAAERAAADRLVAETESGAERFLDFAVAQAEGYVQVTPFAFYGVRA